jgi:hypothetical protein
MLKLLFDASVVIVLCVQEIFVLCNIQMFCLNSYYILNCANLHSIMTSYFGTTLIKSMIAERGRTCDVTC